MIVNSPESTDKAMELIFELVEDYDANIEAIHELADKIEVYEETAPELAEFNNRMKELDDIEKLNSTY
jgi:pyruvate-formate lyase